MTVVAKPQIGAVLAISFYVVLILAIIAFICLSLNSPHGWWDIWTCWKLRARCFFRSGIYWQEALCPKTDFRSDYPLLFPLSIFRCWKYIGYESLAVPIFISFLFTFGTVGLLVSSLAEIRSAGQGFLAGIVLLSTAFFVVNGADQYADIPISFFYLATFVLLYLQERFEERRYCFLILAGITAGFSVWTKNEGFLFLVSLFFSLLAVKLISRGRKTAMRELVYFTTGVLPGLAITLYFKSTITATNFIVNLQRLPFMLENLRDPSRYLLILKSFGQQYVQFGKSLPLPLPLILTVYLLISKPRIEKEDKTNITIFLMTLLLVLSGFFFIFLIVPQDLQFYLNTTLSRLLLQIWPITLFTCFLAAKTPE